MDILCRSIETVNTAHGVLLSALRDADRSGSITCYFKSGFPIDQIKSNADLDVQDVRTVGNGLVVSGSAKSPEASFMLPVPDSVRASAAEVETEMFRGLNTALALRGQEDADTVRQWLGFHAKHHGLEAAILVDRRSAGGSTLRAELGDIEIDGMKRLLVLDLDTPTGHPGMGDEALPYLAPDAPGKARMDVPDPDPWRAPFGEVILYEMLRHRWLGEAKGVMNIDLSDLLAPIKTGTVFDCADAAASGTVQLSGHRIYPWALRPGAPARFIDHICRRFDGRPGNPRWCVAPAKASPDNSWRMVRIRGTRSDDMPVFPYLRCMSLRHPTGKISEIVPKSSLVEDEALLDLMTTEFTGAGVRRPPKRKLEPAAARATNRTGIVTTMKNEGPFILEWLAYHRAIGIEEFLIYTNDCTDGTDTMLKLLEKKGLVHHRENPFRNTGAKPQHAALVAADKEQVVRDLDWVICMDVDEFINIHTGDGRLVDLYAAVPDANMISMTWRLFGNADIGSYVDGFIIEQFTKCAPKLIRKPHQAWGFKTAVRKTGIFKKLGVHRPKGLRPQLVDYLHWVNGSGQPMPPNEYRSAWRSTAKTYGYDLVTLNHYAVRSAESFLVKRDRGRVNHVDRDQGLIYWFRMNNNAEKDMSIQRMIPSARKGFDLLMADPEIAAAHNAAVAAHRAKIDALKKTSKYQLFYDEITSERLRKLSRMHDHFGGNVFFVGPDCIPDDVLLRAGEEGYFFRGPKPENVNR